MTTSFAVLATGPSLTPDAIARVRGRCDVVAVSDAYRLAPWADALVSQDHAWWKHHTHAMEFAGRKFSGGREVFPGTEHIKFEGIVGTGTNSGLAACHVAVKQLGARRLLLLGFDMGGTHFFGPHPPTLKNTTPKRFEALKMQFRQWSHPGVEVINCTPGSALKCFPMMDLEEALARLAEPAAHAA